MLRIGTIAFSLSVILIASATAQSHVQRSKHRAELGSALLAAASQGYLDSVKRLLSKGADIAFSDDSGDTALHAATLAGNESVVRFLLEAGADPKAENDLGDTPLHETCNASIVELLILHRADVNARNHDGESPLHGCQSAAAVRILLDSNAEVNAATREGITPLHIASKEHSLEVVRMLLSAGADVNATNMMGSTPLLEAAFEATDNQSDYDTITELLKAGADITHRDARGDSVLHSLYSDTPLRIVQLLLANGASVRAVNEDGRTPLGTAAESCRLDVLTLYQASPEDLVLPDAFGAPLHQLVGCSSLAVAIFILRTCQELHRVCNELDQMLERASEHNHPELVDFLLHHGANANKLVNTSAFEIGLLDFDESHVTVLMAASATGSTGSITLLASNGAALNATTSFGRTALSIAAVRQDVNSVNTLLELGADPNIVDNEGQTALMRNIEGVDGGFSSAGCSGDVAIVRSLIAHGASRTIRDKKGHTAADIAKRMNCSPVKSKHEYDEGGPGPSQVLALLNQ